MTQITIAQARVLAYLHSWSISHRGEAFRLKFTWIQQDLGYIDPRSIYMLINRLRDIGAIWWLQGNRGQDPLVMVFHREDEFEIVERQDVRIGRAT